MGKTRYDALDDAICGVVAVRGVMYEALCKRRYVRGVMQKKVRIYRVKKPSAMGDGLKTPGLRR